MAARPSNRSDAPDSALRAHIASALERGPVSPTTAVDVERFIAEREVSVESFDDDRWDDLVLARACVTGSADAVAQFLAVHGSVVRSVGRRAVPQAERDDFHQQALVYLLLRRGERPPRIDAYQASGALGGFVRMVVSRFAIDLRRAGGRELEPLSIVDSATGVDPGQVLESVEARKWVADALHSALQGLKPRERRALRMRYVLGFSVARTAKALGMHEVSVSRMVSRVRATILADVDHELERAAHALPRGTLAALACEIEVSLTRWLRTNVD